MPGIISSMVFPSKTSSAPVISLNLVPSMAETSVRQRLPYVGISLMSLIDSFHLPLIYLSASQYVEILRC